jgi:hypothetical protein
MHVFPLRWLCGACAAALLLAAQALATPPERSRHCPGGGPADGARSCPAQCGDSCPAECTRGCPGYNYPCDPCSSEDCQDENADRCDGAGCCDKDRTAQECAQECCEEDCCDQGGCEWTGGFMKLWPWAGACGKADKSQDKADGKPSQTAGCPFGFFAGMFPPGCCDSESCEAGKPWPAKPARGIELKVEVTGCDCKCGCAKCGCGKGASSPQANGKRHMRGHAGKVVCYPAETGTCPTGPKVGHPYGGPGDHVMVWTPGPHMVGPCPHPPVGPPPPPHDWLYQKLSTLTAENAALKARMEAQHEYGQRIKELEQKLAEARHAAAMLKAEHGTVSTKESVLTELLKSQAESSAEKDALLVALLGSLIELQVAAPDTPLEGRLEKLEQLIKQAHEENAELKEQVHELKKEAKRVAREKAEQAGKPTRATRREAVHYYQTPR